jgi:HSP20 family protein
MDLMRWEPFFELDDMRNRLNALFGGSKTPTTQRGRETMTVADWIPAVDISENEKEYQIKVEVPEVKKEDIKVTIKDGVLTIKGERRRESEEKTPKFHRMERAYGVFMRRFNVPEGVDEQSLSAEFKDGMLMLHLPKSAEAQPRAIEVAVK